MPADVEINPNLYQTQKPKPTTLHHTQSTMSFLRHETTTSTQLVKKMDKKIILLNQAHYQEDVQIYNWRNKTQFPIVKVYYFKNLTSTNTDNKHMNNCKMSLEIGYQAPIKRLSKINNKLPLFQVMYLLKQALIGFERLFNKFGSFSVTPAMIILNKTHKCKVWIHQDLSLNQKQFDNQMEESIFTEYTLISKRSSEFFDQVNKIKKIVEAIEFIEKFANQNKIIISSNFKFIDSISKRSPKKMGLSKFYKDSKPSQSIIYPDQNSWKYLIGSENFLKNSSQISTLFKSTYKPPKYLTKKSTEQEKTHYINPQVLNSHNNNHNQDSQNNIKSQSRCSIQQALSKYSPNRQNDKNPAKIVMNSMIKCKSYNYFKDLKHSAITKLHRKSKKSDLISNDGSSSHKTFHSFKTMNNLNQNICISPNTCLTPKISGHRKNLSNFSFNKNQQSPFAQSSKNFQTVEKEWGVWNFRNEKQLKDSRERKYSNDVGIGANKNYQYKGVRILSPPINQHEYEQSRRMSPMNQSPASSPLNIKQSSNQIKINIKRSSDTSQSISLTQSKTVQATPHQLQQLFEKNGWKMQIDSLIGNCISIRQSIKDGKEQRSQFLGTTNDFLKLGRLGRAIQGSMTPDDEHLQQ